MAKTAAERQAAYRAKRPIAGKDGNGERRLNAWISSNTDLALERLAKRYCVTKREMIERLVVQADNGVIETLELDTVEWDQYFNVTQ